jgi:4-amino-4-deoxy-L-arabinose transferase-like glycosyltransferase
MYMNWGRLIASLLVATVISLVVFFVSNDFGITWDEPIHIGNAQQYVAWIKRPIFSDKDKFFKANNEDVHPPFRKLVAGLTHELLYTQLGKVDTNRAYRISALLFVFPLICLLTYVGIGVFGYAVGILVPFMFSFLPHVLFLAPLVTMDYAIAALWFVAIITATKAPRNIFWLVISGICVGLTLLTKLHGYLLFVPIGMYWVLVVKKSWVKLFMLIIIAFVVYIAGWPWLWTSSLAHLSEYFAIQTAHGGIPVLFFGKIYEFAPWWYTPVMFLVTTPVFVLIAFFIGSKWSLQKGGIWDKMIFLNAMYPIVFFSLPGIYRYDWVRLFLSAFPFICLLAGRGITVILGSLRPKRRNIGMVAILFLWGVTVYSSVIRIHPWESSYYNELVGGIKGAKSLGLETDFWGNAYLGILPWMNEHKNYPLCVTPTTHPFYYYQAMGQLDADVAYQSPRETCDFVVVLMRQGLFIRDPYIANIVNTQTPVYSFTQDDVPLVSVYDITKIKD